jgi:YHS domain-containing protein
MEKCPVCSMDVDPAQAPAASNYEGKTYYFCSDACKQQFDAQPQAFAKLGAPASQAR